MIGEDVLSICFLAFVCIIFGSLILKLFPDETHFIIPSFVMICIGLWISYDYMLMKRYEDIDDCRKNNQLKLIDKILDQQSHIQDEPGEVKHEEPQVIQKKGQVIENPQDKNKKEIELAFIDNGDSIQKIHPYMGTMGDTKLFNRMKYSGLQPQLAKDIRAQYNKYSMLPYFKEELDEQENRIWWENNELETLL
jgi:hypothetical protein